MIKKQLIALVLRTRGGHALPLVLQDIEQMSEEEAHQWYILLRNLQEDAERDGTRAGARQPWKGY